MYAVALDPSMGTGGDLSSQVFELSTLVVEWQHNITAIPTDVVLKDICDYIKKETNNEQLYWSVENNGLGEAALIVINDFEENIWIVCE